MASSLATDRPSLPAPGDGTNDPFTTSDSSRLIHHRYSNFDQELFAAGPGSSPRQAKRALEAHLAETERRLDEAGKLGTALVSQRKTLAEQLQEVEKLQAEGELGPDLQKKLVDIEKEYHELARDSARAFLPKQRVPSNETNPDSPHVPQGRSGRRSISPSKFESQATSSPSKLSVPNRKLRNQPTNRVHDIEFAAEISTSLISQVRSLQALLSEREEDMRDLQSEKSKLEVESESLQQRLKTLDESEHRYKDENWNLETRLQEFNMQQKEAADREKRLNLAFNVSQSEKAGIQKDLDEAKLSHSKLAEEHAAATKNHDIELGTAKRSMVLAESEREAMQRKINDLTNQNQELAKAFSTQRGRTLDREPASGLSDEDFETATDNITPEHSPPPSPVKGTPRHSVLESETMRTSLHHAQRTIQSQRSQLHREKTEKLELRRIVQDLRDDLEKARSDTVGSSSNRRSRKVDPKELKKQPRHLGSLRSSREEIIEDDPEWEDNRELSPTALSANSNAIVRPAASRRMPTDSSDNFETANEASESAFETANERSTETEGFQTGHEQMSGSDEVLTETEGSPRGFGRMKRPPSLPTGLAKPGNRNSFISTASTSADEDDYSEIKTPTAALSSQRSRTRLSRGAVDRTSRQLSEEPNMRSSPASFASSPGGTPQAGQSLFAELQDFGSDDESMGAVTPSRRSLRSITPASIRRPMSPQPAVPALPKVIMVDSGVMTDPVKIDDAERELSGQPLETIDEAQRPTSLASVIGPAKNVLSSWLGHRDDGEASRPVSGVSYSDVSVQHELDMDDSLAQFLVPPTSPPQVTRAPPALSLTPIATEHVEPLEAPETPRPILSMSGMFMEHRPPQAEPEIPPPDLTMTTIQAERVDPVTAPELPSPALSVSAISGQHIEPVEEPERAMVAEPGVPTLAALTMSSIAAEHVRPVTQPVSRPPSLRLSSIASQRVEPRNIPAESPILPNFGFSTINSVETEPVVNRRPWRDGFIMPRDEDDVLVGKETPETPTKLYGVAARRGKEPSSPPFIAEDETRQSPRDATDADTPDSQRPFKEISSNINVRPARKQLPQTSDQGAQTSLTADAIDAMAKSASRPSYGHEKSISVSTTGSSGTVRRRRSQESLNSIGRGRDMVVDGQVMDTRRPSSATSARASIHEMPPPPLPTNHRQAIEAARTGSSSGPQGSMGPPLWPASATKQRPRTPNQQRPTSADSGRGTPTPRAVRSGSSHGHAEIQSPARFTGSRSRASSVSSFASEVNNRFNLRPSEIGMDTTGFGPNTDPRMIQAITQTMIGEYLWKYTRKAGRGDMSEKRHRRYFWVHPYTRTLYWSDRDPSHAGKAESKAKSVHIEAVRVVTDDNPMPPGLHRKSLVIISPGRTVKFTCTTGQRHETWFNALSYLLLRSNQDGQSDTEDVVDNITREDVDEFNPQYGRRPANGNRTGRTPSLSSYNSRTTRNESPAGNMSMNIPTLTPTAAKRATPQRSSGGGGTFSRLSGYWKPSKLSESFSARRNQPASRNASIYEASEVHDSAEDLREMIERQDRDSDRLENVRACCDGKHDVGTLHNIAKGARAAAHSHAHPGQSSTTPVSSQRSRR